MSDMEIIRKIETMDINGDFSDYDRAFFQHRDINNQDALWMFSKRNQEIVRMDLTTKKISKVDILGGREYEQVEVYDKKIFCVNRENLMIDIFFLSKRQQSYHKRTFRFTKKGLKLKEHFCLTVWSHMEKGSIYRCVMGPLEDGRYMNFDLSEKHFDYNADAKQIIDKVICIDMALENGEISSDNIVWALDEVKKSFMCYDRKAEKFFEYNDFGGEDSREIEMMFRTLIKKNGVKRMYYYYPFDFFSQKEKNQLKAMARDIDRKMELNAFVRDKYKEVLLCTDTGALLKITPLEDIFLKNKGEIWRAVVIDQTGECKPVDITVNTYTGEIYCLCKEKIRIFKGSGSKPQIIPYMRLAEKFDAYNS